MFPKVRDRGREGAICKQKILTPSDGWEGGLVVLPCPRQEFPAINCFPLIMTIGYGSGKRMSLLLLPRSVSPAFPLTSSYPASLPSTPWISVLLKWPLI